MSEKQFTDELLTDREAAKFLRISRTTLWRERTKGNIDYRLASGKILYTRADIEKYLSRNKRAAFACVA
jgi:predicted DNA-binding transcriptional regulator AlpA